jgi:transporter, major facilitator family
LNSTYGVAAVGGYLAFASILSVVFILLTHETRDVDMNAVSTTK